MPSKNPNSINRASNPDYVDNGIDKGDMSGAAAQRSSAVAKASEAASTEPDFELRKTAKAALANALK